MSKGVKGQVYFYCLHSHGSFSGDGSTPRAFLCAMFGLMVEVEEEVCVLHRLKHIDFLALAKTQNFHSGSFYNSVSSIQPVFVTL